MILFGKDCAGFSEVAEMTNAEEWQITVILVGIVVVGPLAYICLFKKWLGEE